MSKNNKKVLICGAGAIGVFLGTLLHAFGHDVKLFGRRKLKSVDNNIIIDGKVYAVPEKTFKIPKNEKFDFIFVTTKLYDFNKMLNLIKKHKIKCSAISAIQNGLVDTSKYPKIDGKNILPVTVFSGFNLSEGKLDTSPTKVGWIVQSSPDGKQISSFLFESGIPCKTSEKFDSLRTEKSLVNGCLNGLSAIENKPFSYLLTNKETLERVRRLFEESYNILKTEHELESSNKLWKNMIKNWSKLNHYSSTCQDIKSGRKDEIKFFNGYLVELGKKHKLSTLENQKIMKEIRALRNSKAFKH